MPRTDLDQVTKATRKELLALHGMRPATLATLEEVLAASGRSLADA